MVRPTDDYIALTPVGTTPNGQHAGCRRRGSAQLLDHVVDAAGEGADIVGLSALMQQGSRNLGKLFIGSVLVLALYLGLLIWGLWISSLLLGYASIVMGVAWTTLNEGKVLPAGQADRA